MDLSNMMYPQVCHNKTLLREWLSRILVKQYDLERGEDLPGPIAFARNGVVSRQTIGTKDEPVDIKFVDIPRTELWSEHIHLPFEQNLSTNQFFHFYKIEFPYQHLIDLKVNVGDIIITDIVRDDFTPAKIRTEVTPELYDTYAGLRLFYAITTTL